MLLYSLILRAPTSKICGEKKVLKQNFASLENLQNI